MVGDDQDGETPFYVDGHLDLAHNALAAGRDLTLALDALREREQAVRQTALVTLPELRQAHVRLVFATLFALPANRVSMQPVINESAESARKVQVEGYGDAEGAHHEALRQLRYYKSLEADGHIRILQSKSDVRAHVIDHRHHPQDAPLGAVLLMEGADPIREPSEVAWWWEQGLRAVGLSWQGTRYAGGTSAPGPVTTEGWRLLGEMETLGVALDVSHLSEAALEECLNGFGGPVLASHSNARHLTDTDRHLDDRALTKLAERGGVVGAVLANVMLDQEAFLTGRQVGLEAVGRHLRHFAEVIGWNHVGIGSDFDGGFGVEETPLEIRRGADFSKISSVIPEVTSQDVLGLNWLHWLLRTLPDSTEEGS